MAVTISFVGDVDPFERRLPIRKDYAMGDKGGKKDKDKSKKQKADKAAQPAKGNQIKKGSK